MKKKPSSVIDGLGYFIPLYPSLVEITASIQGALLLGHFFYLSRRYGSEDGGWFYRSNDYLKEDTGFTRSQLKEARRILRELRFVEERPRRLEHKTDYRINKDLIEEALTNLEPEIPRPNPEDNPNSDEESEEEDHNSRNQTTKSEGRETSLRRTEFRPPGGDGSASIIQKNEIEKEREKENVPPVRRDGPSFIRTRFLSSNGNGHPSVELSRREKRRLAEARYLPIAEVLSAAIQAKHNVKHSRSQLSKWCKEFRRLETVEGVPYDRQLRVMEGYAKKYDPDEQYCPIAQSGSSFREKFLKIEGFLSRNGHSNGNGRVRGAQAPEGKVYKTGREAQ